LEILRIPVTLRLFKLSLNKDMRNSSKSVADLKIGEKAVISSFGDQNMSLKLLEMGCLPGCEIKLSGKAPLGCPLCITVSGYSLSLRKEEAATILINK
jgi:ferrous iron transport protein A